MNAEIRNDISRQLQVQTRSFEIFTNFRIFEFIISSNFENSEKFNSMFKSRDIYNLKAELRRESLKSFTFIQALIRELKQEDWTYAMQKDDEIHIIHFFFVKNISKILLKINYEVLVMNCTYKTNRYKMSFLIINEQTALHINYYVAFCFMQKKIIANYLWILHQWRSLYAKLKLFDSIVIMIDMKRDLMNVIDTIFSIVNHILCLWHINNNVLINCKKSFNTKKEWDVFFAEWKTLIYASSKNEFNENWNVFFIKYVSHDHCVKYLKFIYIANFRRRFLICYINKILHFEITTISRNEDDHAMLKRRFESFAEDLKTVINSINLLLMNEYHNYLLKLKEEKIRYFLNLRKKIYQQISSYITHYVSRMLQQW